MSKEIGFLPLDAASGIAPAGIFAPLCISNSTHTAFANVHLLSQKGMVYYCPLTEICSHIHVNLPRRMATSNGVIRCSLSTVLRSAPFSINNLAIFSRSLDRIAKCNGESPGEEKMN